MKRFWLLLPPFVTAKFVLQKIQSNVKFLNSDLRAMIGRIQKGIDFFEECIESENLTYNKFWHLLSNYDIGKEDAATTT